MNALALEAVSISKRFGGVQALDRVSLKLRRGSVHALLGENGAGKSTLVKCLVGYHKPDEGAVLLDGRQIDAASPREAYRAGLGMVYQHFTLVPNMSVLENLVLARPQLPARVDWKAARRELDARMADMPFRIPLDAPVNGLSAGEKQKLEIVKQLLLDVRVLILDEPTSVLTPDEADDVLERLRQRTREAGLAVLMITHRFREVTRVADEVTVLRRGAFAGTARLADTDPERLAAQMLGESFTRSQLARATVAPTPDRLVLDRLGVDDDAGRRAVDGFSLAVAGGEIVGVAGVSGNGQRQLVEALAGQRPVADGGVRVDGMPYRATRAAMLARAVHVLPEEPLKNACVACMSVAENLALRTFDRAPFALHGVLRRRAMRDAARAAITTYGVRTVGPDAPLGELSGGNVQRTVLARELSGTPAVLIVANPCFGLDFSAVAEIRARIMAARNAGAAVLLLSEDLDEILELADRIVVVSAGRVVFETTPAAADPRVLGRYMAGHGGAVA